MKCIKVLKSSRLNNEPKKSYISSSLNNIRPRVSLCIYFVDKSKLKIAINHINYFQCCKLQAIDHETHGKSIRKFYCIHQKSQYHRS